MLIGMETDEVVNRGRKIKWDKVPDEETYHGDGRRKRSPKVF